MAIVLFVPTELYSRRERKEKQMMIVNSLSNCDAVEQSHRTTLQKYIWSHDQLSFHRAFSDMLLKLCAFKAARTLKSSGYGGLEPSHPSQ